MQRMPHPVAAQRRLERAGPLPHSRARRLRRSTDRRKLSEARREIVSVQERTLPEVRAGQRLNPVGVDAVRGLRDGATRSRAVATAHRTEGDDSPPGNRRPEEARRRRGRRSRKKPPDRCGLSHTVAGRGATAGEVARSPRSVRGASAPRRSAAAQADVRAHGAGRAMSLIDAPARSASFCGCGARCRRRMIAAGSRAGTMFVRVRPTSAGPTRRNKVPNGFGTGGRIRGRDASYQCRTASARGAGEGMGGPLHQGAAVPRSDVGQGFRQVDAARTGVDPP